MREGSHLRFAGSYGGCKFELEADGEAANIISKNPENFKTVLDACHGREKKSYFKFVSFLITVVETVVEVIGLFMHIYSHLDIVEYYGFQKV